MPKLTKRRVEALPRKTRDYVVWDDELRGFGVRVWPSGKRTYVVKYRTKEHRQRKETIGQHGTLTAEQARNQALQLLGAAMRGEDPARARRDARTAPTVSRLAQRYIEEHARPKKRPGSAKGDEMWLRLCILPRFGSLKVNAVSRADIARLHRRMGDRPFAANRTLALLSKMFSLAENWGWRADNTNPCRHVQKYHERKIERFLSNEELARLGAVLDEAEQTNAEPPSVIAAIRLLLLTGCRLNEILTLKWSDVDLECQVLRIRESKTGAKTVVLSDPCLDVLRSIKRQDDNPYVIVGKKPRSHLVNLRKPWYRIRAKAGLDDVRIHDLRHTYASFGVANGLSLPLVGALLGHSQPQTTARYGHVPPDPLRQAAGLIASGIASAVAGQRKDEGHRQL